MSGKRLPSVSEPIHVQYTQSESSHLCVQTSCLDVKFAKFSIPVPYRKSYSLTTITGSLHSLFWSCGTTFARIFLFLETRGDLLGVHKPHLYGVFRIWKRCVCSGLKRRQFGGALRDMFLREKCYVTCYLTHSRQFQTTNLTPHILYIIFPHQTFTAFSLPYLVCKAQKYFLEKIGCLYEKNIFLQKFQSVELSKQRLKIVLFLLLSGNFLHSAKRPGTSLAPRDDQPRPQGLLLDDFYTTLHQRNFENGVFTMKTHQMFAIHITPEKFENKTITGHFRFVFEEKPGRLSWFRRFQNVLRPHENEKPASSNFSGGLKSVFEKLRFCDGLVLGSSFKRQRQRSKTKGLISRTMAVHARAL